MSPKPESAFNTEGNSESGTKILTTDDTSDNENTGKPSDIPELLNFQQVSGVKKESDTKILTTDDTSNKENTGKPSDVSELLKPMNFQQVTARSTFILILSNNS